MSNIFDLGGNTTPKARVQLDINQANDVVCSQCENKFFQPVLMFKKISALLSPTGKESILPIESFACTKCGNVNSEFLPKTHTDDNTIL